MKKLFGLGKGLNSLIPAGTDFQPVQKDNIFYVEVAKIEANSHQPRQDFDEEKIKELSQSIRKYGVLQPLLVSKVETTSAKGMDVSYHLIAGERRLRAAKLAGLPQVPVVIRDEFKADQERLEVALIENVQREDLNAIEEAEAYQRLANQFKLTQKDIADKVGKSREAIANAVRLLNLPREIREALRENQITKSHARALLAFSDADSQKRMFQQMLAGTASSKDAESAAATDKKEPATKSSNNKFVQLEKNLTQKLNAPVLIHASTKGGKIVIRFAGLEELNTIAKNIID